MKSVLVCGLKGGTGKSLISAMLATHLSQERGNVLLIDADIDSPNLVDILKVDVEDLRITPDYVEIAHLDGMDFFSMGLFAKDKAISMSSESYVQMLLDIISLSRLKIDRKKATIIIDAPAGASSVFKACIRAFADSLVGAVVVITPQAYRDLKRLIKILKHYELPIIGVVENMAYFVCECGEQYNFSDGRISNICREEDVNYLGQIPFSKEIYDIATSGIPYIPDVVEPVLTQIVDEIDRSKPVGRSILAKLTKAVSDKLKRNISKIVIKSIIRANKEINLKNLTAKGFGGNVIELIITDKGEFVTQAYLKLTDNKLIALKEAKPDLTITVDLNALIDIAKGKTDLEDAFYLGDIEVFGKGGTVRALSFFEQIWKVMKDEVVRTVGEEVEEYETA